MLKLTNEIETTHEAIRLLASLDTELLRSSMDHLYTRLWELQAMVIVPVY